ncbi:MAG: glycosyltransferase family 1 protein [Nostoc sp.]|uniref:glycosyltransferase family 4 protein n=1 Tax=Nostoc sp. TaxID=1180 RepID=UPI002FF9002A
MKNLHISLWMAGSSGWMGGAIYIQNLARAIASLSLAERANTKLSIVCLSSDLKLVKPILPYVDQVYMFGKLYLKICHSLAGRLVFLPPQIFNPLKIDFLYPTYVGSISPYSWGSWIPDFQHHYFPEFFSKEEINKRDALHQKIADSAPIIVLSSQMAQSDFHRLYPKAASRTKVMNFASYLQPEYFELNPKLIQEKYGISDSFFLVSNQFWKHKNHDLIVEALGILKQNKIYPTVVFTGNFNGKDNYECFKELSYKIEKLEISKQIHILGLIPRIDQIQLMRMCLAVIQPSLFEGWSTVIEDARALGKPMLVSDFPVHLEQNPPFTLFFERHNPEQLASLISEVLDNFQSGINLEQENAARQNNFDAIQAYGRRFLGVANTFR